MPGAQLPSVAVVILTGGGREVFEASLAAALADPATTELLVIVDHDDPSGAGADARQRRERLDRQAAADPRLRVHPLPADDGQGLWRLQRGRDAGVELARSEVILALDDDVVLDPGTVTGHARAHAGQDQLVMVGYMPVITRNPWPDGNATVRYYSEAYEAHCEAYEADRGEILKALWGGNVSLRRQNWLEAVKRPRVQAWGHDDQELGLLLLREGMRGSFDRSLSACHHYQRSLAGFVERAEKSPAAQAGLVAANPDLLAAPTPIRGRREKVSGPVLWLSRWRPGWSLIKTTLEALIAAAGVLSLDRLGDKGAHYLWYLARERAVRGFAA